MMTTDVEVVIAGAGPAGAAAAIVLARRGRRVLMVNGDATNTFKIGEAVPPAVRPLMRELGIPDRVLADDHLLCCGNISVWGSYEPVATDFIFDPNGHGWHLDRNRFDATLRDAAVDAGAQVVPGRVIAAVYESTNWTVTLAGMRQGANQLRAGWFIDATGRQATGARWAGASRHRDDTLVAFYSLYQSQSRGDHDGRTAIESEPDGWWYTARIPSGKRLVAFLTDVDLVDRIPMLSPTGFAARLEATNYVHGLLMSHRYEPSGTPRATAAQTGRLDRVVGDGWAAVGDAAISFDPLSSQGILTALFTGLRAGLAVDSALAGDRNPLDDYANQVTKIYRAYHRHRDHYYAAERRWPDRPFWQRRRAAAASTIARSKVQTGSP